MAIVFLDLGLQVDFFSNFGVVFSMVLNLQGMSVEKRLVEGQEEDFPFNRRPLRFLYWEIDIAKVKH